VKAGGTWEGRATDAHATDRGDAIGSGFTGTGGYAGLTCVELVTRAGPLKVQGHVFPGRALGVRGRVGRPGLWPSPRCPADRDLDFGRPVPATPSGALFDGRRCQPYGARDPGPVIGAVAVGVLVQVLLVVFLGEVERACRGDLGRDGAVARGVQARLVRVA